MRIATLSNGAIVIKEGEQEWLFGAPEGVSEALKSAGINVPAYTFLTSLRSPGVGNLGGTRVFKEKPLNINGLRAKPVKRKHGTDFIITTDDASVLFSERGDVSSKEIEEVDFAIIKNKNRADSWGDNVISWPWPDAEYSVSDHEVSTISISTKIYSKLSEVPDNLKKIDGVPLTISQVNWIVRIAEGIPKDDVDNPWAVAKSQFKKSYRKEGNKWVRRDAKNESMEDDAQVTKEAKKEAKKNSEGRTASDHLIVKDPDDVSTWHLPVKTNGKIDTKLMEAAAAALASPGGHSGMKYGGPDKDEAVRKLVAMYRDEEKEIPENLERAYRRILKEYTSEGPVRRLGEAFVAKLHKAYNDFADKYFEEGFISQEERKDMENAVGKMLYELSKYLSEDVYNRPLDGPRPVPLRMKELVKGVKLPDEVDGTWSVAYKDDEGNRRWASVTSVAIWDYHNELVPPEALKWAVKFAKIVGPGPLRFKHIPGLDGGVCDHQSVVGGFLFESGSFDKTPLGQAMWKLMKNDAGWQISPGLAFSSKDLKGGRYRRCVIFERSITKEPANPGTVSFTTDGGYNMKRLTDEELEKASDELELPFEQVKKLHEAALKNLEMAGLKEFKEFVTKELANKAKKESPNKGEDEEDKEKIDEEEKTKKVKAILKSLDPEQREFLQAALKETEKPVPEGNINMEIIQLKELIVEQNKQFAGAFKVLAEAIAGKDISNRTKDLSDVLSEILEYAPRSEAAHFVSKEGGTDATPADEKILAQLKAIDEKLAKQSANPFSSEGSIYNLFTSRRLNEGQGEVQNV